MTKNRVKTILTTKKYSHENSSFKTRYIATTFRHVIPTVGRSDQGAYYCEADNGLGQAGKAELQVKKACKDVIVNDV